MATPRPKRARYHVEDVMEMLFDGNDEIPSGSDDELLSSDSDPESYHPDDVPESDADDSADDAEADEPTTSGINASRDAPRVWHWLKRDLPPHVSPENHLVPAGPALHAKTPLEMFSSLFDDDCMQHLLMESNRYRMKEKNKMSPITLEEMRVGVGITFYMSLVELPNRRMNWSPKTRQAIVADAMTVNRYEEILSVLHANDNNLEKKKGEPGFDNLHKVRPLIDMLSSTFARCAEPEMYVSVDEQIIPFKGRHSLKVYMLKKPKKWGYKVWVQAGQSGYVHKFFFAGDTTVTACSGITENVGKAGEVVVKLTEEQPRESYVFFDNYFASPDLLVELKKRQLHATCTMRANRSRKCPLLCLKDLKKKGRGAYDFRSVPGESILLCEWFDNKIVLVASNIHGVEPHHQVRRYDRKNRQYINVMCPGLIKHYNANMGGVDKCDMLLSLYRNQQKSKKWYRRIIFHLLDLCIVNAWLLYKAAKPEATIPLAYFKLEVAESLIVARQALPAPVAHTHPGKTFSAKNVCKDARFDHVDHLPQKRDMKNAMRCKQEGCNRKTLFICRKCEVFLCITGKNGEEDCFFLFHSQ